MTLNQDQEDLVERKRTKGRGSVQSKIIRLFNQLASGLTLFSTQGPLHCQNVNRNIKCDCRKFSQALSIRL